MRYYSESGSCDPDTGEPIFPKEHEPLHRKDLVVSTLFFALLAPGICAGGHALPAEGVGGVLRILFFLMGAFCLVATLVSALYIPGARARLKRWQQQQEVYHQRRLEAEARQAEMDRQCREQAIRQAMLKAISNQVE